jgi:hypothetical protein
MDGLAKLEYVIWNTFSKLLINFTNLDPIRALVYSAVINVLLQMVIRAMLES